MLSWSKFFQNPEYLDLYRKMIMDPDYVDLIAKWIHLKDKMKILDVGCGTGAFTYYLANKTKNSCFYGIDIDELFIQSANEKINKIQNNMKNKFHFSVADALSLPFNENTFDIVVSYTALTNIPNSKLALDEMIRVTKPNGHIASVTSQSFSYVPQYEGIYPSSHSYYYEYKNLRIRVQQMYESIQPILEYTKYGTDPEKIPSLFAESKLNNIEMHPIGNAFSLSNSTYTLEEKKEFIEMSYKAEYNKFCAYMQLDEAMQYISQDLANRYLNVLLKRKEALLSNIEENTIWEWFGGAQILVCGQKL